MSAIAFTVLENEIIGLSDGLYFTDYTGKELSETEFRKVYKPAPNYLAFAVGSGVKIWEALFTPQEKADNGPIPFKLTIPGIQSIIKSKYDQFEQNNLGRREDLSHGVFIIGYDDSGRVVLYELTKNQGETIIPEPKTHWPHVGFTVSICDDLEGASEAFSHKLEESLQTHTDHEMAALEAFTDLVNEQKQNGKGVGGEIFMRTIERPSLKKEKS